MREHPRIVAIAAGSVATAAGALIARRRTEDMPDLPDAATVASEAAAAVHNAAKASVISAAREHLHADRTVVLDAVRLAVFEAGAAGADLTAAALGAVEGAIAIASPLGEQPRDLARAAAVAAADSAGAAGDVAQQRVRSALSPLLSSE